jgi:hypothetical protein
MALIVVARCHTLAEAQVAASALRSAGLSPQVFDEFYGTAFWVSQAALGGYRLLLPDDEAVEARALLRSLPEPEPLAEEDAIPTVKSGGTLMVAAILTSFMVPEAAWAITDFRRTDRPRWRAVGIIALALAMMICVGIIALAVRQRY